MMAYFKLNCLVEIETQSGKKIRFNSLHSVETYKSLDKVGSSAKIKIPTSARLNYANTNQTESVQTAKVFKRGDKVHIQLGYNGNLVSEFKGFIYKINLTTPLEIECEGYEFLLRQDCPTKTFASTTLKEVLNWLIAGTEISINGKIPDVNLTNFVIPKSLNKLDVLQQLKERYGITIYFADNVLYAGLDFIQYLGTVKYKLGWNTVKEDELKYQYEDDVKLRIKAVLVKKDNTKLEAEVGDKDGQQRTLYFYNVSSKAELEKLALAEMKKYKFSGYTGKITTFLEPFAAPGMVAEIMDEKYNERGGKYEIRSVKTTFGQSGARRSVEIGKTVSNGW